MIWLRFLSHLSLVLTIAVDAIVLCHVYPAFKRTRNKAFIFIAIACVLGIIDTVYDHTVSLQPMGDPNYIVTRTFRRLMYFADLISWCIGIVLLVRPVLNAHSSVAAEAVKSEASPNDQPPLK